MKNIRKEIEKIDELVSFPNESVRALLQHKTPIDIHMLIGIAEADPSLTVKLLRLANSAFYGLRWNVSTISHAVKLLGVDEVQRLIIACQLQQKFFLLNQSQQFYFRALWKHSIAAAMLSRIVTRYAGYFTNGEEFTAGLLHDMGKIVLAEFFPEELSTVTRRITDKKISDVEAEKEIMQITHEEIGSLLAQKWNLPECIAEVMRAHHDVQHSGGDKTLTAIIRIADVIAEKIDFGIGETVNLHELQSNEAWSIVIESLPHLQGENIETIETTLISIFHSVKNFVQLLE